MILAALERRLQENAPMVTVTWAQSLDGSISRKSGVAVAISSKESFVFTHELRAKHSAIVIGIGTLLADNPSLTTRLTEGDDPWPVVIDTRLRTPLDCKLFTDERCKKKPLLVCSRPGSETAMEEWSSRQVELVKCGAQILEVSATESGHVDLAEALEILRTRFKSVMIEGGARILTSLLSEGKSIERISCIVLTIAPAFFGGVNSMQSLIPEQHTRRWKIEQVEQSGGDILVLLQRT